MFHITDSESLKLLIPLFQNNPPSFLIDTVLEGVAGVAAVDQFPNPNAAMLAYADIVSFGGDPFQPGVMDLISNLPFEKGILPLTKDWESQLRKTLGDQIVEIERYSFSDQSLNPDHLQEIVMQRPQDYFLHKIDKALAEKILSLPSPISEDHIRNFGSIERFLSFGLGYCLLDEQGDIASIASSYASCSAGIEIQVNTVEEYRGEGLAAVVSAALILDCLEKGLSAHWDAANLTSARLAERLGYTPLGEYEMLLRIPDEE